MNIRLAQEKDYDSVISLMGQLNPDDKDIHEPLGHQLFSKIVNTQGLSLYLVEIDGKAISTCYLNVIPNLTRSGLPYALIENVVTDGKYRRKGIAKMLLKRVIADAFSLDCYKIMLLTGRESEVHTFYEHCGFEKNSKTAFVIRSNDQ